MSKKILQTTLSLVFLVSLFACSPSPTPNPAGNTRPAITDSAQPIEVQTGEMFHIVIDSNPTTGYHWEVVGELNGVEFISTEYTADEPVITGSGGVDVWTFKAVASGETQITLGSYPPGATEFEQTVSFTVVIK